MARNLGRLVVVRTTQGVLAVFRLQGVDVNGSVGRLGCNVLVERIPRDALDVVAMLCDLTNEGTCLG